MNPPVRAIHIDIVSSFTMFSRAARRLTRSYWGTMRWQEQQIAQSRSKLAAVASAGAVAGTAAAAGGAHCRTEVRHEAKPKPYPWTLPKSTSWTLEYFPIPGTPGEIVRVLLGMGGDAWTDARVPGKEWGAIKPSTKFGVMPELKSDDGVVMTQSRAIARYLAKTVKVAGKPLYPEDPWLAYRVDELVDAIEDVRSCAGMRKTFSMGQAEKEAARAALFAPDGAGNDVFAGLKRLEGLIGEGGHMVGGATTLADVWLFVVVNQFRAGWMDGVPADGWMEQLPKLQAVVKTVGAVPELKAYYEKGADTEFNGKKLYEVFAGRK